MFKLSTPFFKKNKKNIRRSPGPSDYPFATCLPLQTPPRPINKGMYLSLYNFMPEGKKSPMKSETVRNRPKTVGFCPFSSVLKNHGQKSI